MCDNENPPPLRLFDWLKTRGYFIREQDRDDPGVYVYVPDSEVDRLQAEFENAELECSREISREQLMQQTCPWNHYTHGDQHQCTCTCGPCLLANDRQRERAGITPVGGARTDPGPGPWDKYWCDPGIVADCPGHDNHHEFCSGYTWREY